MILLLSPTYCAHNSNYLQLGVLNLFGEPAHPYPTPSGDEDLLVARSIIKNAKDDTSSGIEFTEVMEGNIYIGDDIDDFEIAARAAIDSGETTHFYLSAHAWDTNVCELCLHTLLDCRLTPLT